MKRPARNVLFLFAGEAGARFFGFLVSAFLARSLGVDGFGQIGFAMSIMAYGIICTKSGLLAVGIRESAQDRSRIPALTGNILSLRFILGGIAVLGMVVFALLVHKDPTVKWLLVVFSLGVIAQALLLEWVFMGIERTEYISVARILTNLVYFVLVIVLVRGPGQILLVPIAFSAATLAGAAVLWVAFARRFGRPRLRLHKPTVKFLVSRAWPIGIATILTQLHVNLGIVGLALFRTDVEAGLYSAAHRLVFFVLMLDRIFQAVFYPVISRHIKYNRAGLPVLAGTALRAILAAGLPVSVGFFLLASPVVLLVFGGDYAGSVPVLQTLIWFIPLSLLTSLAGYSLLASGRERRFARNTVFGVAASVLFIAFGIAFRGTQGAAFGIVAGELCLLGFMARDFLKTVKPRAGWRTLVPVFACVGMVPAIILLRDWNWVVAAVAGAAVYLAILALGKGITLDDLGLLRKND